MYVQDNVSSVYTPPIQLKDFEKIFIKKGESKTINFKLTPQQLSLYNIQMREIVEPGDFTVMIGAYSDDIRLRGGFVLEEKNHPFQTKPPHFQIYKYLISSK